MKRIDAHCHIYPDAIAERAVSGIGHFYDLPLVYRGTLSDLIEKQDAAGISNGVIFSVATTPHQVDSINRFIAKAAEESNGRFVGLGALHPESETLKEDIETILSLGLRGVKLHPDFQRIKLDDYRCLKIFELCEGRLPVLLHTGDARYDFSNPNRLAPVLSIFSELTVIGAHFGGWSVWDEAEEMLTEFPNFYVDTSSSFYAMTPERAKRLFRKYGASRVLFATDYPMWRFEDELRHVEALDLCEEEKHAVFYGNAARIFGFSRG